MADPGDGLVVVVMTDCIDGPAGPIASGVLSVIDHFQQNAPARKPKLDLRPLEGRYESLWAALQIVTTGDKVFTISPDTWQPFVGAEDLVVVNNVTFKVGETDSFRSEGEQVTFTKVGGVASLTYNGATFLPADMWARKQKGLTSVVPAWAR